jgi:hypothetical protein
MSRSWPLRSTIGKDLSMSLNDPDQTGGRAPSPRRLCRAGLTAAAQAATVPAPLAAEGVPIALRLLRHRHRHRNRQDADVAAILHKLVQRGQRACGMKPIAAGAEELRDGELHNEDAAMLRAAGNVHLPQHITTPFMLREPARRTSPPNWKASHRAGADPRRLCRNPGRVGRHRGRGRGRLLRALLRRFRQRRPGRAARPAGDPGGRPAPGLHQPRPADRRSDRRARPGAGRLGRQPGRPRHALRRRERRGARTAHARAAAGTRAAPGPTIGRHAAPPTSNSRAAGMAVTRKLSTNKESHA